MKHICEFCKKEFSRRGSRKYKFCSKKCESGNNRKDRPSDEWLNQKYTIEKMTCPQIAKMLSKDAKTIYTWMKDANIPTRGRGEDQKGKPKDYSSFKGKKHTKEAIEKIRQARLKDGHVPYLNKDGKHWLKGRTGAASPNYKGGITPERQKAHTSEKWKKVANLVWRRDNGKCQRCGISKYDTKEKTLHIHHKITFANEEFRYELDNLILLCRKCHLWVHSRKNTEKEFIIEQDN